MKLAPASASTLLVGAFATAAWFAPQAAQAAETASDRAATEKQLADARSRLEAAAADVARLTRELHGNDLLYHGGIRVQAGAMIGVNVGDDDAGGSSGEGVVLRGVSPGGPAERAGLRTGDVLTAIDGRALKRSGERSAERQLVEYLREQQPGGKVKVDYRREGKAASVTVQTVPAEPAILQVMRGVHAMPFVAGASAQLAEPGHFVQFQPAMRGLELVPLTPRLGQYFGTERGLLVVRSPAESGLPLQEGDVLQGIGGRTPENASHAFRILRSYQPGEKVALRVLRQRKALDLEATMPAGESGVPQPFTIPLPPPPPTPATAVAPVTPADSA